MSVDNIAERTNSLVRTGKTSSLRIDFEYGVARRSISFPSAAQRLNVVLKVGKSWRRLHFPFLSPSIRIDPHLTSSLNAWVDARGSCPCSFNSAKSSVRLVGLWANRSSIADLMELRSLPKNFLAPCLPAIAGPTLSGRIILFAIAGAYPRNFLRPIVGFTRGKVQSFRCEVIVDDQGTLNRAMSQNLPRFHIQMQIL